MKLRDIFSQKITRSDKKFQTNTVRQDKTVHLVKNMIENDSDEEFASRLLSIWLRCKPQDQGKNVDI
jgi:hypothetical protein